MKTALDYSTKMLWLVWLSWTGSLMVGTAFFYVNASQGVKYRLSIETASSALSEEGTIVTFKLDNQAPASMPVRFKIDTEAKKNQDFQFDGSEDVKINLGYDSAKIRLKQLVVKKGQDQDLVTKKDKIKITAVSGNGYEVDPAKSEVELDVLRHSITNQPPPEKPALSLERSDEQGPGQQGKGPGLSASSGVDKVGVTFNLSKRPTRPVRVPIRIGGDAKEGVDFQVVGLPSDRVLVFDPLESSKTIAFQRLDNATRGQGPRKITVTYDALEVKVGEGATTTNIAVEDPEAKLSWALDYLKDLSRAEDGQVYLNLSVAPKRDEEITVYYSIELDPRGAGGFFSTPEKLANGQYIITLRPSESKAQRFFSFKATDMVGGEPWTLKLKKQSVKPPDLKTDMPDLTLTVGDDAMLDGSTLIVVVYTKGLKTSETVNELIKVEGDRKLSLVGKHIYLIDKEGILRRWSPSRNKSFEGLKPFEDDAKFENILNLVHDSIKLRIATRMNASAKTAIVWEDLTDRDALPIAEKDAPEAPDNYHLFWIGPPSDAKGLGKQLKKRFKNFYEYQDPINNLSQGMSNILK